MYSKFGSNNNYDEIEISLELLLNNKEPINRNKKIIIYLKSIILEKNEKDNFNMKLK